MSTQFGQDTACLTDVGPVDLQVTDPRVLVGQRIARILQTPLGALANVGDDPGLGFDVKQLINAKLSPSFRAQSESRISAQCSRDECVQSASVTITQNSSGAVGISIGLTTAAGPFTLVLNVDQLTVQALFDF